MIAEKKRVLITVKAYPNPSKKYGETVCCAGVVLSSGEWIRLYPIQYRDLDDEQKFKKYSIVDLNCSRAEDDKRPESYRVQAGSIKVIEWWDTKDRWERRKKIVLPTLSASMCQVYKESEEKDKSLALVKPSAVSFSWEKAPAKDQEAREACYAQLSFFDKTKNAIEAIPYNFYYSFKCAAIEECPGHKMSIIDWELGQAFRSWRRRYPDDNILLEKIKERWLDRICSVKNDVYFYVGNMKRFRRTFMILGAFYPPK
ncbi:MAG: hypothetical protein NT030_08135 [Candidatus Saganbacteria bacterium]|nr:hypothetical protein [Candidatus Saganbacteria bacterium]